MKSLLPLLCVLALVLLVSGPVEAQLQLISIDTFGVQANGESQRADISLDGRFVAFASNATNLDPADTNGDIRDIYLHDLASNSTRVISLNTLGEVGAFLSTNPSISANGQFVAFESPAPNLVPMDMNGGIDVFVRDTSLNTTERVSLTSFGDEVGGNSFNPAISGNGLHVSFDSGSSALVIGDENNFQDVFVKDRVTGLTTMISQRALGDGMGGNDRSGNSDISRSGRWVVFESRARDLVMGDTNIRQDIFLRDRDPDGNGVFDQGNETTIRVSVSSTGAESDGNCSDPAISANGRFITFSSDASNLVPDDTNGQFDVFVHDTQTGTTTRVSQGIDSLSVGSIPVESNGFSGFPVISEDGRFVAFESLATNLSPGDTNFFGEIFLHDRNDGTTNLLAIGPTCEPGNQRSRFPSISAGGDLIVFDGFSDNLVDPDTNGAGDVFLFDRRIDNGISILSVLPDIGSEGGNEHVRLIGGGFTDAADTTVSFNGMAATLVEVNPTLMVVKTPPGTGLARVVVTNRNGCEVFSGRYAYADPFFTARFGHVNEDSGDRADVLFVNSRAGNRRREIVLGVRESIRVEMMNPPTRPSARFVLYAWLDRPRRSTLSPLPIGLGELVLPAPLTGGMPQPAGIWNTLGRFSQLGTPTLPSMRAPTVVLDAPQGSPGPVTFTLQGIIEDSGSRIPQDASVTNAVIVEVR